MNGALACGLAPGTVTVWEQPPAIVEHTVTARRRSVTCLRWLLTPSSSSKSSGGPRSSPGARQDRMRDVLACTNCVSLRARALAPGTAAARPLPATVYRPRACTLLALAVGVRLSGGYPRSIPGHTAAEVRGLEGAPSAVGCANLQAAVLSLVETEPARSAAPLVTATHSSFSVAGLSGWRPRRLATRRKQLSIRAAAEASKVQTRKPRKPAATKAALPKAALPKAALPKAAPRAKAAPKSEGGAAAARGRGRGRGGRGGRGRGGQVKPKQEALTVFVQGIKSDALLVHAEEIQLTRQVQKIKEAEEVYAGLI